MASDSTKEFSDANFRQDVLESDVPVLVDFWAVWCAPCRAIAPTVEAIAEQYAGRVKAGKLNVDHHPLVAAPFMVRSIPTLLLFDRGCVAATLVGVQPRAQIEKMLEKVLAGRGNATTLRATGA